MNNLTANINKLDKLLPFLEIFIPCTMHIVRNRCRIKAALQYIDELAYHISVNLHTAKEIPNQIDKSFTHFWGEVNLDFGNFSEKFRTLFFLRYQTTCTVDVYTFDLVQNPTKHSNSFELLLVQKMRESYKRKVQLYQPNFILVMTELRTINLNSWFLPVMPYTGSKIMLLDISNNKIYFSNVILENSDKRRIDWIFDLVIMSVPLFIQDDTIRNTASLEKLVRSFDSFYYPKSNLRYSVCTLEMKTDIQWYGWIACAEELAMARLNCTTDICLEVARSQFRRLEHRFF